MTLTNSLSHQIRKNKVIYPALVTATTNDTTDPFNGPAIDITGLDVAGVAFAAVVTSAGASTTTANLIIQGSNDASTWVNVTGSTGSAISTGATTIGAASTTVPVGIAVDSGAWGRSYFSFKYLRPQLDQGGVAGFTGVISGVITTR